LLLQSLIAFAKSSCPESTEVPGLEFEVDSGLQVFPAENLPVFRESLTSGMTRKTVGD